MNDFYTLGHKTHAVANARMNNDTVKKMWNSFCLTEGDLEITPCEEFIFQIEITKLPTLSEDKEYAIKVDEKGIAVVGKNYGGLVRGFMSLLMKIEQENTILKIRSFTEESDYKIKNRMIHICVFPENDLYFIKKIIRLSAMCQYTHIVIEFWGMLKYDCLKELAWPNAFTKDEVKELIDECKDLGIEPIPMFNQLGHAPASRSCYGKHVVLDQNPALQELFTPDGWAWNILSDNTFKLLSQVRKELYELFGDGEYFHLGCDEAHFIGRNDKLRKNYLPEYLKKLTEEVESEGRRPLMWVDMLLQKEQYPDCLAAFGEADEVEALRNATSKSTIFIDWQYDCKDTPIPTLDSLKNCGRDCMGAPWYEKENYAAYIKTVTQNNMFGIMLTTWHTLNKYTPSIVDCAECLGAKTFVWGDCCSEYERAAVMLRRISFEGNTYEDCGWTKKQIEV